MPDEDRCERFLRLAYEEYRTIGEYERLADQDPAPEVQQALIEAARDEARHFRAFLDAFNRYCRR